MVQSGPASGTISPSFGHSADQYRISPPIPPARRQVCQRLQAANLGNPLPWSPAILFNPSRSSTATFRPRSISSSVSVSPIQPTGKQSPRLFLRVDDGHLRFASLPLPHAEPESEPRQHRQSVFANPHPSDRLIRRRYQPSPTGHSLPKHQHGRSEDG